MPLNYISHSKFKPLRGWILISFAVLRSLNRLSSLLVAFLLITNLRRIEMHTCQFCEKETNYLPKVGIGLSMAGWDYTFCEECLRSMTADEFWRRIFVELNYAYPPKLINEEEENDE